MNGWDGFGLKWMGEIQKSLLLGEEGDPMVGIDLGLKWRVEIKHMCCNREGIGWMVEMCLIWIGWLRLKMCKEYKRCVRDV